MVSNEVGNQLNRRGVLAAAAALAMPSLAFEARATPQVGAAMPKLTCFIRYQIDPFQREAFAAYAAAWGGIIPRCGGHLVGYFLPSEGTNDVGWGLIAFDGLAAYEAYRVRLKADPESKANFAMAQAKRFIFREERTFLETVEGTFHRPPVS